MEKTININDLPAWLINRLTNAVHNTESNESEKFNKWAKSFDREEARVLVSMEFGVDWGHDTRTEIPEDEAENYAQKLLKVILDNWNR